MVKNPDEEDREFSGENPINKRKRMEWVREKNRDHWTQQAGQCLAQLRQTLAAMKESGKQDEYLAYAQAVEDKARFKLQTVAAFLMNEECHARIVVTRRPDASIAALAALSAYLNAGPATRKDIRKPKWAGGFVLAWGSFRAVKGALLLDRLRRHFPGDSDTKLVTDTLAQHGIVPRHAPRAKKFDWPGAFDGDIDFVMRPFDSELPRLLLPPAPPPAARGVREGPASVAPAPSAAAVVGAPCFKLGPACSPLPLVAAAAEAAGGRPVNAGEGVADWLAECGIGAADLAELGLGVADVEAWQGRAGGGLDSEPVSDSDARAPGADDSDWPPGSDSGGGSDSE